MDYKDEMVTDIAITENGKVVFAPDVIATIAGLAATEVPGVSGLAGTVMEGISTIFGKNSMTKGVKVEVGQEEAAVDISINVRYGERIQDVSVAVQKAIKDAIETMTALRVIEVNVMVQSVTFEDNTGDKKPEVEQRVK